MDPSQNESLQTVADDAATAPAADRVPVDLDDWELEDDFHVIERLAESLRIDDAHAPVPSPTSCEQTEADPGLPADQPRQRRSRRRPVGTVLAWSVLSLGLVAFVFGGALLAWSFIATRGDLWCWGMPLTLVGQALLLVGVVLQIDGLWQKNTQTAEALDELDEQIFSLRHTTTLLGTTHSSPAQSFYAHVVGGASPHMLLADLKGQLDVLAMRLAQERR